MSIPPEILLKLPCIKESVKFSTSSGATNDFDLMMETNTSTNQWKVLWSKGDICPELLPVMCDTYKQNKWSCTNVCRKKVAFLDSEGSKKGAYKV